MSKHWTSFLLLLAFLGCGGSREPFTPAPQLFGGWRLDSAEQVPLSRIPAQVSSRGVKAAFRAVYKNDSETAAVELFEMQTAPSAFELVQQWRPEDGKLAGHYDRWFFTVECPGAPNTVLSALADAVEDSLRRR